MGTTFHVSSSALAPLLGCGLPSFGNPQQPDGFGSPAAIAGGVGSDASCLFVIALITGIRISLFL